MSAQPYNLAARIVGARTKIGMSKSGLAREVGVSPTCVWNWEEGNTEPRPENLSALSRALKVSVDYLRSGAASAPSSKGTRAVALPESTQSLVNLIAEAKEKIATAAGLPIDKVRIALDY